MSIHVRPATVADDAALLAVDRETWTTLVSPAPTPDWSVRRAFFRDDRRPDGFLVAELDGAVVGYVALHQEMPMASHAHVLTIDGLAVLPSAQGRGVGTALVEAAVSRAATLGVDRVTLRVLAHNTAAQALYGRCGFVEEGVLRGEFVLDGHPVDDVLMATTVRR